MANLAGARGSGHDFDRGRRIGKYEILSRLSVGGMAELYLAFVSGPGGFRKFVALKQILPDVRKDHEFVNMFLDEARITAAFSHPNITQVFELGEERGELYLVMEFLAGRTLDEVNQVALKRQMRLPLGFVARAARDTCLALHYAHHFTDPTGRPAVVVHRDVTPRNMMITYDGTVKVIDFGVAKARNRLGRTMVGQLKGTTAYMSPEQARGKELDGRSDLFSLGIVLHEALCGQRLFQAPHEAAVMVKILEEPLVRPSDVDADVPEELSDVVMKALERDPARRFANGREMARALEEVCGSELYDEEQMSGLMHSLFAERIRRTRALLGVAGSEDDDHVREVIRAFHRHHEEEDTEQGPITQPMVRAAAQKGRGEEEEAQVEPDSATIIRPHPQPPGESKPALARAQARPGPRVSQGLDASQVPTTPSGEGRHASQALDVSQVPTRPTGEGRHASQAVDISQVPTRPPSDNRLPVAAPPGAAGGRRPTRGGEPGTPQSLSRELPRPAVPPRLNSLPAVGRPPSAPPVLEPTAPARPTWVWGLLALGVLALLALGGVLLLA